VSACHLFSANFRGSGVIPNSRLSFNGVQDVTFQKTESFITIAVTVSNPTTFHMSGFNDSTVITA
jgi:hypothetical protein